MLLFFQKIDYFQTLDMPLDYCIDLKVLEENLHKKVKEIEDLDPECEEWEYKRRRKL